MGLKIKSMIDTLAGTYLARKRILGQRLLNTVQISAGLFWLN